MHNNNTFTLGNVLLIDSSTKALSTPCLENDVAETDLVAELGRLLIAGQPLP